MESRIAKAIRMDRHPVALAFADEPPAGATRFEEGKWGCVMWLLASAAKGRTAAAGRTTFGCFGGGVGLGFGNVYEGWPGGIKCFYHFLSTGNEGWEHGRQTAEQVRPFFRKEAFAEFVQGERYFKSPELVRRFVDRLPMTDIPKDTVVFKPLAYVAPGERPEVVVFLVDPDRLSALVVLANYARESNESVIIPYAAGCQTIGIYPFREARAETPRAVVGLTDLSARKFVTKQLGHHLVSFAVPFSMFEEMEANVEGSFLERETWKSLMAPSER